MHSTRGIACTLTEKTIGQRTGLVPNCEYDRTQLLKESFKMGKVASYA